MQYEKPVNQCRKHLSSMSSLASILYKEGKQRQTIILKCSIDSLVRYPVLFLTFMVFLLFYLLSPPLFLCSKARYHSDMGEAAIFQGYRHSIAPEPLLPSQRENGDILLCNRERGRDNK